MEDATKGADPLSALQDDASLLSDDDEFLRDLEYLTSNFSGPGNGASRPVVEGSASDSNSTAPISNKTEKVAEAETISSNDDENSEGKLRGDSAALLAATTNLEEEMAKETTDMSVTVDDPEKHATAMESFITFRITTKTTRTDFDLNEYSVRRRYNDFLWLRQKLELEYPALLVPPLPAKESLKRLDHFSKEFTALRAIGLGKFMSRLAHHPVLSFSQSLHVFLTAKAQEFLAHKKQGSGLLSRMADSLHSMSASYMMKNRSSEHVAMQEYITILSEKLSSIDRISQRILKEQAEYIQELRELSPIFTLWSNYEDTLSQALTAVAATSDKCTEALKEAVCATETEFSIPLKEYMLYTDAIKAVLRRRDAIQMEYEITLEELNRRKEEKEQLKTSDQSYSLGSFMGKNPEEVRQQKEEKLDHLIEELTKQVEVFNDRTVVANADLKADMERWHANKKRDMKEMFTNIADKQVNYYQKCLGAWEEAISLIQSTDQMAKSEG